MSGRAERRVRGQLEDARAVLADAQLQLGAEHPLGDRAADLRGLDGASTGQGGAGRQCRPRRSEGRAQAGGGIGRPADHREPLVGQRDPAQAIVVAGGRDAQILLDGLDLADEHAREPLDERRHGGDLDTGVDEAVGDRGGREVRLDELEQPAVGDLHGGPG